MSGLRMVIVGLHYAPEPSGNAPYTTAMARGLAERGHDVRVVTGVPHYPDWVVPAQFRRWRARADDSGVELVRLRHPVPGSPRPVTRAAMESAFGVRAVTDGAIGAFAPDAVVCVSPALLSSALVVARERRRRRRPALGLWVQDLYSSGVAELHGASRAGSVIARIESATVRSVDGVAVAHERFRSQLMSSAEMTEDRVRVLRNWTHLGRRPDGSAVEEMRRRLGWGAETVVLHAGNMGLKQGLSNVVEAARLADERGLPIRFVLLGGGNQEPLLREAAAGVQRLQFVGSLDSDAFGAALAAADVLLVNELPGVAEMSVPSKLTSYFASGRPVLAATGRGSVTAQEVHASGGGVCVESGDPRALVEAALALGQDVSLAARLGEQGQRFAHEHLGEESAMDRFESWLGSLLLRRDQAVTPRR